MITPWSTASLGIALAGAGQASCGGSWGSRHTLRSHCRAGWSEFAREIKTVPPFCKCAQHRGTICSRGSKLPDSSRMWCWKEIRVYMWVQLSLKYCPHWNFLCMETETTDLILLIMVALYLSNSSVLPVLPLWIHYFFLNKNYLYKNKKQQLSNLYFELNSGPFQSHHLPPIKHMAEWLFPVEPWFFKLIGSNWVNTPPSWSGFDLKGGKKLLKLH